MAHQFTARISDDADVAVKLRSEDVLRRLWLLREAEGRVEAWLGEAIMDAREAGRTWDEIGQALGVTRQAAWQRYRDRMRADLDASRSKAELSDEEAIALAVSETRAVRRKRRDRRQR